MIDVCGAVWFGHTGQELPIGSHADPAEALRLDLGTPDASAA